MYIEPETGRLRLGRTFILINPAEIKDYQKQRNSQVAGEAGWPDERILAFVLWKSGNPGLSSLIKFYDNITLKPEF